MVHPFYSIFEEWTSNKAVGLSVLQTFEGHFNQAILQHDEPPSLSSIMKRMQAMAPSFALAAYTASSRVSFAKPERTFFELQDEYIILQNCAREAQSLSQRLCDLTEPEKLTKHLLIDSMCQFPSLPHQLTNLEVALMMVSMNEAVMKETEIMVRVASALQVEMRPEDLFAYIQIWKLSPYIDEDLRRDLVAMKESVQYNDSPELSDNKTKI
jgi:hypothetical protein